MDVMPSDGEPSEGAQGRRSAPPIDEFDPTPDDDAGLAALLEDCARGDDAAFARLYDLTATRVFGLALRVIRDPAQAEEVSQEVYHEVWSGSGLFDRGRGSAVSWLLTLTHRRAVDRVRSADAAARRDTAYEARTRPGSYDQTAETATENLEAAHVRRALAHLSDKQRAAIELAYLDGHTHTEVAEILDLPLGTAKTRIRDGLTSLRHALGGDRP